jgi:D-aminopeptidase
MPVQVGERPDAAEYMVNDLLAWAWAVRGVFRAVDDLLLVESRRTVPARTSSTMVGSGSRQTACGTCLPTPVSEKKVLNASSQTIGSSDSICPFGWTPCSTGRTPTGASDLETHLAPMNQQNFTHVEK